MKKKIFVVFFFILISCNSGHKPFEKRINKLFGGPVFRNLTIGDSYDKVLKTENKDYLQFLDSNIIKYMYHVSDTEEYHWAYLFEEDRVKEIHFDAYLGEVNDGAKYIRLLQKKYDKILGNSNSTEGYIQWRKEIICAKLYDESKEALMGKVRFIIFSNSETLPPDEQSTPN